MLFVSGQNFLCAFKAVQFVGALISPTSTFRLSKLPVYALKARQLVRGRIFFSFVSLFI